MKRFLSSVFICLLFLFSAAAAMADYQTVEIGNIPRFRQRKTYTIPLSINPRNISVDVSVGGSYADCGIDCVAMIEGHFKGYNSENDLVYHAVMAARNPNVDWANVTSDPGDQTTVKPYPLTGYAHTGSMSPADVYAQLQAGNPVMVHRPGSNEHWVLIYGYDGPTSSLSLNGFKTLSPTYAAAGVNAERLTNLVSSWDSLNHFMYRTTGLPNLPAFNPVAPSVSASVAGTEVDVTWNDVGASSYYIYVQNQKDQSIPFSDNVGRSLSAHFQFAEGNYIAYVTAVYSEDNMKTGSCNFTLALSNFIAPTVNASVTGTEVDVTWNDVGASSYYIYVQNQKDQSIPFGENIGRKFSAHFQLSEGSYVVYVTAVYSDSNMKTGSHAFAISPNMLAASIDKGPDGSYELNEPVVFSLNGSGYDSYVLRIIRTPTNGVTYTYWEGETFGPQYEKSFPEEGAYACCFIVGKNGSETESQWVGWTVREHSFTVSYDANGGVGAPEPQVKESGAALSLSEAVPTRESEHEEEGCTISFDANGITEDPPSMAMPFRTKYTFLNWNTEADGSGTSYAAGGTYEEDKTAVLYAQWKTQTIPEGILLPSLSRDGYVFLGWATFKSADSAPYQPGTGFGTSSNTTLYAVWKQITFILPADLTRIEDEAFAEIKDSVVRLPDNVNYVSPNAFDPSVTLVVTSGSASANAVKDLGLTVIEEHVMR